MMGVAGPGVAATQPGTESVTGCWATPSTVSVTRTPEAPTSALARATVVPAALISGPAKATAIDCPPGRARPDSRSYQSVPPGR